MPNPLTLSRENIQLLMNRQSAKISVYMALLFEKDAASNVQSVNTSDYLTNWNITDDELLNQIIVLSSLNPAPFNYTVPSATITWASEPVNSQSLQEVRNHITAGFIDDNTTKLFKALYFKKQETDPGKTSLIQTINPNDFSAPESSGGWGIDSKNVLKELIGMSKNGNFNLDVSSLTINWLQIIHQ